MVNMIANMRGFQVGHKVTDSIDETLKNSYNLQHNIIKREVVMIRALYTAATGMKAQQLYLDNVANNLANINTTGFKRSQVNFQDLLYDKKTIAGSESAQGFEIPSGIQLGGGVRPISTTKVFVQGKPATNRSLDLAIEVTVSSKSTVRMAL